MHKLLLVSPPPTILSLPWAVTSWLSEKGTLLIEMSEAEDGSLGLSWSNNNGEDETLPDATEIILLV